MDRIEELCTLLEEGIRNDRIVPAYIYHIDLRQMYAEVKDNDTIFVRYIEDDCVYYKRKKNVWNFHKSIINNKISYAIPKLIY